MTRRLVALGAIALVVGFVGRGCIAGPARRVVAASAALEAGPLRVDRDGIGSGFARTVAGARAAARGWVAATGRLHELGVGARRAVERFALASRVDAVVGAYRLPAPYAPIDELVVDYTIGAAVLFDAVTDCTRDRCEVRQFVDYVIVSARTQNVLTWFGRAVVDVVWNDGDWRCAGIERELGPMPLTMPDPPAASSDVARDQLASVLGSGARR